MVYFYVGVGGAIGSILRYFLSFVSLPYYQDFPLGTPFVNLLGTFLLGWFVARIMPGTTLTPELKTGISTGIIGSFTTFSTLSVEVMNLINESQILSAFIYIALSIIGGITLSAIGFSLGEKNRNEVNGI